MRLQLISAGKICQTDGMTGPNCNEYDLAFNKPARQKEEIESFSASLAVDNINDTCTNPQNVTDPWWRVDIGRNVIVRGLVVFVDNSIRDVLKTFSVEVEADDSSDRKMCYSNPSVRLPVPYAFTCLQNQTGRHVIITGYTGNATISLRLCSVGVYGSCVQGTYGTYCSETCGNCRNASICNPTTGQCPSGCDVGYTGSMCKDLCPFGTYGNNCASLCGKCQYNATCFQFTGMCPNNGACEPGYQTGNCTTLCPDGTWGLGCIACGNCKKSAAPCDKFSGVCKSGCQPGYEYTTVNMSCLGECDDEHWGDACGETCGKCHVPGQDAHGPCSKVNGSCAHGCAAGYYQTAGCNTECGGNTYGLNCALTCGRCGWGGNRTATTCYHVTGDCLSGCQYGWKGRLCNESCAGNEYGPDCKSVCGNCKDNARCAIITGSCPNGCTDGYNATDPTCKQVCDVGYYGSNCSRQCHVNCAEECEVNPVKNVTETVCNRKCSNVDGTCTCKDGWTGPRCEDPCAIGYYGPKCATPCGNCKAGTFCRQVDGWCPEGCADEWCGYKCDLSCKKEEYKTPVGPIVGGSIGGVIGGGLIIAFTAWVVWRYKKDKSIALRSLAKSMRNSFRRLSQRSADGIRRSVQRLSRRGKRAQDKSRLDSDDLTITDGGKGGGKHHVNQMYECAKIHSNSLHEDTFPMVYLQLQGATKDGRTLLHDCFKSFLEQRPKSTSKEQNGHTTGSYYNVATEDIKLQLNGDANPKIPAFLPLGSNLSGFLLINESAASTALWNHLQQRQIETIISVGKEASCTWRPGERLTIGLDVVECIDMQLQPCHRETKLVVSRQGMQGRRAVRHLELYFWSHNEVHPNIGTLLLFMDTFRGLHRSQRERSIIVNYVSMNEQAVLFTLVASMLEILAESRKVDILRTVAIGGKATDTSVRTFDEFKFLHDIAFNYLSEKDKKTPAGSNQTSRNKGPTKQQVTADIAPGNLNSKNGPNNRTKNFASNNNNTNPSVSSNQAYVFSQRNLSQQNDGGRPPREAGSYGRPMAPDNNADPLPIIRPLQPRAHQQALPEQRYLGMDSRSPGGQSRTQPRALDEDRSFRPIETDPQRPTDAAGHNGRPVQSSRDPREERLQHGPSPDRPNRPPSNQAARAASPGRPLQDDFSQRRTRDSSPGRDLEDRPHPRSQYADSANPGQNPGQGRSRANSRSPGHYEETVPSSSTIV
ncbi:hypothetical protein DPMN_117329 [Dreissena polymorpha]|uniref:Tyrosine-protein phosphatase domain-containing protein n=1 Tax=Dreissena polymorpha TaxID=45954 RepID=A0A9D4KQE7_DREPO|nr:hypothetical protein DPMN_117329 [Dreissena polymorpha]